MDHTAQERDFLIYFLTIGVRTSFLGSKVVNFE